MRLFTADQLSWVTFMGHVTLHILMRALVLSGGGLFGAWQAGAWSVLAERLVSESAPDLIVGASVGSLNGYLIASGATPEELRQMWLDPTFASLQHLPANIRRMMAHYMPRIPFAITATELPRMKPRIFRDSEITWQHLAASCALPIALPQVRIGETWYSDGGLLGALPLWAAAELGADRILGLQALPESPSWWLRQMVRAFRGVAGHNPPVPPGVRVQEIRPGRPLGSARDTIQWKRSNIERWLDQGAEDARRAVTEKTFSF
jgi:predicted acylesterase/phospholipase RssA